jgi:putative addiction module killer protein
MYKIKLTTQFNEWLNGIKDRTTRLRLNMRLDKASRGLLGDVKQIDEAVWEMREFFGPGWRMYFIQQGDELIVMLGGGDKSTQSQDIKKAIALSKTLEE